MRYYILYVLTFLFSTSHAQIQDQFFVDDVESIAYVTMNVCEDANAKVSSVTLVADKTTYANDLYIKYIRKKLLSIQFYSNSAYKNTCYEVIFSFINSKYKEKKLNDEDCNACKKFKKGRFQYENMTLNNIIIERNRSTQKEINGEVQSVFSIEWISNCSYIMTYKKSTRPRMKHLKGEQIYVDIIDVLDDGRYVYKSEASFRKGIHYGILKKIK